jgi:hypothetical protein
VAITSRSKIALKDTLDNIENKQEETKASK